MPNSAPPRETVSALSQDFLVDAPFSLSVAVPGAHIRLRPGSNSERVEVDISVTGCTPDEAKDILKRMGVGAQKTKNMVSITSDGDRSGAVWWRWIRTLDVELHVDLQVPSQLETEIRAPGGAVDLADLQGYFDVKVMGGPCRVENVGGTLDIRAESSDVSIQDVSGKQILARAAGGSLTLENVEAHTITARTVAAPMTLTAITGATRVTAKSAPVELQSVPGPCLARVEGGPLSYDGQPTDEIVLEVVGTALDAHLPPDHGADLHMTGPTLTLAEDFSFDGERSRNEIEGTLNDGGPSFSLTAIGGSASCHAS